MCRFGSRQEERNSFISPPNDLCTPAIARVHHQLTLHTPVFLCRVLRHHLATAGMQTKASCFTAATDSKARSCAILTSEKVVDSCCVPSSTTLHPEVDVPFMNPPTNRSRESFSLKMPLFCFHLHSYLLLTFCIKIGLLESL